ncbi:MAG: hypothetical protein KBE23_22985 [Chloroflexi bacterium]|nr:hypothetical protein [Chloroflexota bacterium]MBP7045636.1 hypothetical protein [Chloroflexota bacterium]
MLLEAYKTAKFIRHDDLWRARLLTMLAWHARAGFGPERAIWYNGRHPDQWADARVLAARILSNV